MAAKTTETIDGSLSAEQLESYLKEWALQNENREAVHQKVVQSLKNAREEITSLKRNFTAEAMSRNQFQIQNEELEAKNKEYEKKASLNSYVIVLVDGDGAKFQDNLMSYPETGGADAANRLKKQVDVNMRETPFRDAVEVFVRVYANFHGLCKALRQAGIVGYGDDVQKFARGFTNTRAGFDFIDVDYGKENADSKIRHLLKWHSMDERCKKIFFVACHDAGYVHDLRPLLDDNTDRIVLVETTPVEPAFKALGLPITHFDDVFRDAALETRPSVPNHALAATPPQAAAAADVGPIRRGSAEQRSVSWAKACGDNAAQRTFVISNGKKKKPMIIRLNEDGDRVDLPIPDNASREAKASFMRKLETAKRKAFCNKHYLEDGCAKGPHCEMEHDMELTPQELSVLRFKARTGPCPLGPRCIDVHCSRGHHCPMDPSCRRHDCQFGSTKFGDMHLSKDKMKEVKRMGEGALPEYI